ncbi:uncharacterized protein LOC124155022 [Ischnura elegans]|uniref:uncharacterized protein LOC124155022 n=1 Tax=Ischnura elegans TaxID=197161 RepID=UPI001ED8907A|nr:uncharacterized protein LOC124155022 [Ischnura elegans]
MSSNASSQGPWMRSRGSSWIKAGPIIAYIVCSALLIVVEAGRNYKIVFEKFVVVSYDENFADFSDIRMEKFNRSTTVLSGEFKIFTDPREDLLVSVEGYEKIGTQYMLSGIQVKEEPLCAILEKFGPVIMNPHDTETTNFKMECPIVKGAYFVKNFRTDEKNMPDDVPGNDWRFDVKGRYPEMVDTTLFHTQTYLKVERDILNWKPGAK